MQAVGTSGDGLTLSGGAIAAWAQWVDAVAAPRGPLAGLTGAVQFAQLERLLLETGAFPELPVSRIAGAFRASLPTRDSHSALPHPCLPASGGPALSVSGLVECLVRCSALSAALTTSGGDKEAAWEGVSRVSEAFGEGLRSLLASPTFAEAEALCGESLEAMLHHNHLQSGTSPPGEDTEPPPPDAMRAHAELKAGHAAALARVYAAYAKKGGSGATGGVPAAGMAQIALDARLDLKSGHAGETGAASLDLFLRVLAHWSILGFEKPCYGGCIAGAQEMARQLAWRIINSTGVRRQVHLAQRRDSLESSKGAGGAGPLRRSKGAAGGGTAARSSGSSLFGGGAVDPTEVTLLLRKLFESHSHRGGGGGGKEPAGGEGRLTGKGFSRIVRDAGLCGPGGGQIPLAACDLILVEAIAEKKKRKLGATMHDFVAALDLLRRRVTAAGGGPWGSVYAFAAQVILPGWEQGSRTLGAVRDDHRVTALQPPGASGSPGRGAIASLFTKHRELFELVFSAFTIEAVSQGRQWGDGFHYPEGCMLTAGFEAFADTFGLTLRAGGTVSPAALQILFEAHAEPGAGEAQEAMAGSSGRTGIGGYLNPSRWWGAAGSSCGPSGGGGGGDAPPDASGDAPPGKLSYGGFLKSLAALSVAISPASVTTWPERLGRLLEVMSRSPAAEATAPSADGAAGAPSTASAGLTQSAVRRVVSDRARLLAKDILHRGDRHDANGSMSVNEMRTFLQGTPHQAFGEWLSTPGSRGVRWKQHDRDVDGAMDLSELEGAVEAHLTERESRGTSGTRSAGGATARGESGHFVVPVRHRGEGELAHVERLRLARGAAARKKEENEALVAGTSFQKKKKKTRPNESSLSTSRPPPVAEAPIQAPESIITIYGHLTLDSTPLYPGCGRSSYRADGLAPLDDPRPSLYGG